MRKCQWKDCENDATTICSGPLPGERHWACDEHKLGHGVSPIDNSDYVSTQWLLSIGGNWDESSKSVIFDGRLIVECVWGSWQVYIKSENRLHFLTYAGTQDQVLALLKGLKIGE